VKSYTIPDHVPPTLVKDFNLFTSPAWCQRQTEIHTQPLLASVESPTFLFYLQRGTGWRPG